MTPPRLLTLLALSAVATACAADSPTGLSAVDDVSATEAPTATALLGPAAYEVVRDVDGRLLAALPDVLRAELTAPLARLHRSVDANDAREQYAAASAFLAALDGMIDRAPDALRPDLDAARLAVVALR